MKRNPFFFLKDLVGVDWTVFCLVCAQQTIFVLRFFSSFFWEGGLIFCGECVCPWAFFFLLCGAGFGGLCYVGMWGSGFFCEVGDCVVRYMGFWGRWG